MASTPTFAHTEDTPFETPTKSIRTPKIGFRRALKLWKHWRRVDPETLEGLIRFNLRLYRFLNHRPFDVTCKLLLLFEMSNHLVTLFRRGLIKDDMTFTASVKASAVARAYLTYIEVMITINFNREIIETLIKKVLFYEDDIRQEANGDSQLLFIYKKIGETYLDAKMEVKYAANNAKNTDDTEMGLRYLQQALVLANDTHLVNERKNIEKLMHKFRRRE